MSAPYLSVSCLTSQTDVTIGSLSSIADSSLEKIKEEELGHLSALPLEIIFLILSQMEVPDLLQTGLLNRAFYWLCGNSILWKKLILNFSPNFTTPILVTNWRAAYRQEVKDENNFLLFRQRTCSNISENVPHCHPLSRTRAFTGSPISHYFSFDGQGSLQAIFYEKVKKVYNVHGRIQEISPEEWNVKALIHRQFIFLSFFDGRHPFSPKIDLKHVGTLNADQNLAVQNLQRKINAWFEQTAKAHDLDEQVAHAMRNHYNPFKTISCVGGDEEVSAYYKAYFIFLRSLMKNPEFENTFKFSPPPFFILRK